LYGVLRPVAEGLTMKAICPDTALLLLSLDQPRVVPGYFLAQYGTTAERELEKLVLDGIVLVVDDDGRPCDPPLELVDARAESALHERLSRAAICHVVQLGITDARVASDRLYAYNRSPLPPKWRVDFRTPTQCAAFLELGADEVGRQPEHSWRESSDDHWIYWNRA